MSSFVQANTDDEDNGPSNFLSDHDSESEYAHPSKQLLKIKDQSAALQQKGHNCTGKWKVHSQFFYDCLSTKSFLCWKFKRSSFAAWSLCCSSSHSHPCCLFRLLSCLSLHYTAAFHRLTQLILLRQFLSLQAENVAWQVHKQVLWQKHSLVPGQASISTKPGPSTSTVWAGWKEHLYSPKGSTCMQRKEHTLNSIG